MSYQEGESDDAPSHLLLAPDAAVNDPCWQRARGQRRNVTAQLTEVMKPDNVENLVHINGCWGGQVFDSLQQRLFGRLV